MMVPAHRASASAFSLASLARYAYRAAPRPPYAPATATTRLRPPPQTFTRPRHQSSAATSADSVSKKPPHAYLVRTASLPRSALEHRPHPLDRANYRYQISLGDSTGLTKLGVHYCRLPPGATSTTLHWHSHEDEWFYVLQAGEDARLLVWEPNSGAGEILRAEEEEVVPREERVRAGDFVGFKAGVRRAHAFKAGGEEMVYLVGGSREPLDVSCYPAAGKRQVTDLTDLGTGSSSWTVEDKEVKASGRKASWPVVDLS